MGPAQALLLDADIRRKSETKNLTTEKIRTGTAVTYLRAVNEYLTQNNAVPNNFDTMVINVMKTATTEEFQFEVKMLAFARKREGNKRSADSILDELQTLYHNLVASKKWTPLDTKANKSSAFAIDYTESTCWNCGKKGHAVSQCTDPKNESAIQKARTDFFNSRNKKQETSKPLTESLLRKVNCTKMNLVQGPLTSVALVESGQDIVPQNMLARRDCLKEQQRKLKILAPQQFSQKQHVQDLARLFSCPIWIEYSR